jgi:hypothetical protein
MNSNLTFISLMIVLAIVVILLGPFIVIWGLNVLFPMLAIPYTFETWLAVLAVRLVFQTNLSIKK